MVSVQINSQPRNVYMSLEIPVISDGIPACLASQSDDFIELKIDLNRDLIQHPSSTYFAKVSGESMMDAGIYDGDLIIIDRSLTTKDGDIAVCVIERVNIPSNGLKLNLIVAGWYHRMKKVNQFWLRRTTIF